MSQLMGVLNWMKLNTICCSKCTSVRTSFRSLNMWSLAFGLSCAHWWDAYLATQTEILIGSKASPDVLVCQLSSSMLYMGLSQNSSLWHSVIGNVGQAACFFHPALQLSLHLLLDLNFSHYSSHFSYFWGSRTYFLTTLYGEVLVLLF